MKRTHLSTGRVEKWRRSMREKHTTACGTTCDNTKATTDPLRVTCLLCRRKAKP